MLPSKNTRTSKAKCNQLSICTLKHLPLTALNTSKTKSCCESLMSCSLWSAANNRWSSSKKELASHMHHSNRFKRVI